MEPRYFHGELNPDDIARALMANFNRSDLRTQQIGNADHIAVQIATPNQPSAGGETAITVSIEKVQDGVAIQLGKQNWLGVAASLGKTAFIAWRNPLALLSRLDDIAHDIENIQLADQIWQVIENTARAAGANFELSERLRRIVCPYCDTANPVGEANCIACGAPLGTAQPNTCSNCGFVVKVTDIVCPNCGHSLLQQSST